MPSDIEDRGMVIKGDIAKVLKDVRSLTEESSAA